MKDSKKEKVKVQPKTPAEQFLNEYKALCAKYSSRVVGSPAWRMSRDTGDFRLIINYTVGAMPRKS